MTPVHVVVPDGVDDPARPSGGNTYDRQLCTGLAALGWDVQIVVVGSESRCGEGGFTAAALERVLSRVPSGDTVLLDGLITCAHPEVLRAVADRLRLVVLVHLPLGLGGPDDRSADAQAREAAALRRVDAVVATSRWTRHWLLDTYRLDPARVTVAVPGVVPAPEATGDPAGRRLLCVGAVVPGKGHDLLVEALARAEALGWDCECVGSLQRDPGFVERLRLRVGDLGLTGRVRFAGALGGTALDAAYARTDLLVSASRGETYGMAVTEALARGIPVLAARVGGLPQALGRAPSGRRPGILVPPGDAVALAGGLERWLGDPALRLHLRRTAAQRRATLPRWSATSAGVAGVLRGLAA